MCQEFLWFQKKRRRRKNHGTVGPDEIYYDDFMLPYQESGQQVNTRVKSGYDRIATAPTRNSDIMG
jgi:hypothetical protein